MVPTAEILTRMGEFAADHRFTALAAFAVGMTAALATGEAVVVDAHGQESHQANGQVGWLKTLNGYIFSGVGMDAKRWTSAHVNAVEINGQTEGLMHHGMTDTNIYQATVIEQYLRTIEKDPAKYANHPTLPKNELIHNLDPSAHFTLGEVREIGSFGIAILEGVMGDDYEPPQEYTKEEARRILDTSHPRYTYTHSELHDPDQSFTPEERARILLADPYSPALEPLSDEVRNGPRGTHKHNSIRFLNAVRMYTQHPEYSAPFIQNIEVKGFKDGEKLPLVYIAGCIAAFAAFDAIKNGVSVESVLTGAAAGGLLAGGVGIGVLGEGTRMVNAGGHAGKLNGFKQFMRLFANKPHTMIPNPDGTYMTTLERDRGFGKTISRVVDLVMYGELFGQPDHHYRPDRRKYTGKEGVEALADNPTTTIIQWLADRSLLGLRPGKGFGEGQRPDVANSIVRNVIQPARVRTVYGKQSTTA